MILDPFGEEYDYEDENEPKMPTPQKVIFRVYDTRERHEFKPWDINDIIELNERSCRIIFRDGTLLLGAPRYALMMALSARMRYKRWRERIFFIELRSIGVNDWIAQLQPWDGSADAIIVRRESQRSQEFERRLR